MRTYYITTTTPLKHQNPKIPDDKMQNFRIHFRDHHYFVLTLFDQSHVVEFLEKLEIL